MLHCILSQRQIRLLDYSHNRYVVVQGARIIDSLYHYISVILHCCYLLKLLERKIIYCSSLCNMIKDGQLTTVATKRRAGM